MTNLRPSAAPIEARRIRRAVFLPFSVVVAFAQVIDSDFILIKAAFLADFVCSPQKGFQR